MPMKWSTWRSRHRVLLGTATSAAAVALIAVGVPAAALATHPSSHAGPSQIGPGYPPPGGIYKPFTNCPLLNPLMQESAVNVNGTAMGCIAGDAVTGSIKLGNITTPVVHPVTAQFGAWNPPNAPNLWVGGILPPPAGLQAQLVTSPEFVPGGLLQALGCSTATSPVVKNICTQAENFGGKYLKVFALAQSAGQITNFALTTWTQPVKFKLINPLLGNNCYIGSDNNPVVINPSVTGTLGVTPDPNPTRFPNVDVLAVTQATATDTTFSAPGVTGCGPGGAKNIPVDEAIDAANGLPAASGVNSLTLNGNFFFADSFGSVNPAKTLLAAFKASIGTASSRSQGSRRISAATLHGHYGIR
jgi:hypothetical protein